MAGEIIGGETPGRLLAMVDVAPLRDRFEQLEIVFGPLPLATALAAAVGFDRNRDGGEISSENAVNGVRVALGLAPDRFGGVRTRIRRYRAMQFDAAFSGLASGYLAVVNGATRVYGQAGPLNELLEIGGGW